MEKEICLNHEKSDVLIVCLNPLCNNTILCHQCFNDHDKNHLHDLVIIQSQKFTNIATEFETNIKNLIDRNQKFFKARDIFLENIKITLKKKTEILLEQLKEFLYSLEEQFIDDIIIKFDLNSNLSLEVLETMLSNKDYLKEFLPNYHLIQIDLKKKKEEDSLPNITIDDIKNNKIDEIKNILKNNMFLIASERDFGISDLDYCKKQELYKPINYDEFLKIKTSFINFYNMRRKIPVLSKYESTNMCLNLLDRQLQYNGQWIHLKKMDGSDVLNSVLIDYEYMQLGLDNDVILEFLDDEKVQIFSKRQATKNDSVLYLKKNRINLIINLNTN